MRLGRDRLRASPGLVAGPRASRVMLVCQLEEVATPDSHGARGKIKNIKPRHHVPYTTHHTHLGSSFRSFAELPQHLQAWHRRPQSNARASSQGRVEGVQHQKILARRRAQSQSREFARRIVLVCLCLCPCVLVCLCACVPVCFCA